MTTTEFASPEFVQLSGYRMAYREWGQRDATATLVLVHGITSSSLTWIRVGPALGDSFRVIAVDQKGHGDSDRPQSGYRLADQASEVAALCAELGVKQPLVMGHSWGGAVALYLATNTDLVQRLVLEDPAIGIRGSGGTTPTPQRPNYRAQVGLTREEALELARPNLALGWTEEDVAGKVDAAMKGSPESVQAVWAENPDWDLHDLLPKLSCPTLLIRAEMANGGIVDAEAVSMAEANPNVRVVTVPGADHNIHRGKYDAFMAEVRPFLSLR